MILCKTTARNTPSLALRCVQRQFTSSSPAPKASQEETPPLLELRDACLGFPGSVNHLTSSIDLTIHPPLLGGHALLGRNGTGKSLLGQTIVLEGDPEYLKKGDFVVHDSRWHSRAIAHVSFNSHKELVREGGSTYKAIAEGGSLSKAAQFLVVRFGLYPLLRRDVETLSTGEMRKVLLVRALANRPKLLILDNAFDGLDVASREILKELVQKTISGFTQDILVQGVNSSAYPLEGTVPYLTVARLGTVRTPCLVEIVDILYSRGLLSISLVFEYTGEDESATVRTVHYLQGNTRGNWITTTS